MQNPKALNQKDHHIGVIFFIVALLLACAGTASPVRSRGYSPLNDSILVTGQNGIAAAVDSIAGVKPSDPKPTTATDTARFKKQKIDLDHEVVFMAKDSAVISCTNTTR